MASDSKYKSEKTCPPLAGIIVSADDFGKNSSTNKNILELLSLKKLHRVSVMINGIFSEEEARLLLDSSAKLDLHLNFFNLLENERNSRKKTGNWGRLLSFLSNYLSGKITVFKVAGDWNQQLEKFRIIFQKYPDGLNSHEHIHFFPPYFRLISALAKKSGITYLRLGRKDFLKNINMVSFTLFLLRKFNRRLFQASNLGSSDFLVSLDWLGKEAFREISQLPPGEIELMVHPEITAELEFLKNRNL